MTPEQARARQKQLELEQEALTHFMTRGNTTGGEDHFLNPVTGQMTSRELLQGATDPEQMRAGTGGAMQGAGYQFGDEIIGVVAGALKGIADPNTSVDDAVTFERERARATLAADSGEFPKTALAGEIGGGVVQGMTTMGALGMANPAPLSGRIVQSAGLGAGEGFLYGTGRGEGTGRVGTATKDTLLGTGVGIAAPIVISGGRAVVNSIRGAPRGIYDQVFDVANTSRANNALAGTVDASGKSVDDVSARIAAARALGQPEFTVADALGDAGRRKLNSMTRSGGEAAEEISDYLLKRQAGQPERIGAYLEDAFDMRGAAKRAYDRALAEGADWIDDVAPTAEQIEAALTAAKSAEAERLYDASRAMAGPVNLTPVLETLDAALKRNPILGESALTETVLGKRLTAIRNKIATSNSQLVDYDTVLNVKIDTGNMIETLRRKGPVPPQLYRVRKALDAALEASSDGFRAANDAFASASREIDAIAKGTVMARPSARSEDVAYKFKGMSGPEQATARVGYGNSLLARNNASGTVVGNRAATLQSPKRTADAAEMALDPETLAARLQNETDMHKTMFIATQGSRTTNNAVDVAAEGGALGLVASAPQGVRGMVNSALGRLLPIITGKNPATRKMIADALLSQDATKLVPGVNAAQARQVQMGLAAAIMRGISRPALADQ